MDADKIGWVVYISLEIISAIDQSTDIYSLNHDIETISYNLTEIENAELIESVGDVPVTLEDGRISGEWRITDRGEGYRKYILENGILESDLSDQIPNMN